MRRRIYLLSTALILALANLMMLPITANSVVPVAWGGDSEVKVVGAEKA